MLRTIFYFTALAMCVVANANAETNWDDLRVTFGADPLTGAYSQLPRTVADAVAAGWTRMYGCAEGKIGERYVLSEDQSIVLIYDADGKIAGTSSHVPAENQDDYNFPIEKQLDWCDRVDDVFVFNAYFTDSETICTPGRSSLSTGNQLTIKSSKKELKIALDETNVDLSFWTKGECFFGMGQHYWASMTGPFQLNTKFGDSFPAFLLYNKGQLTGWGWTFSGLAKWMKDSTRYERVNVAQLGLFITDVPAYVHDPNHQPWLSMHYYMTNSPQLNRC